MNSIFSQKEHLLVVYVSFSSLGSNIDNDADMTLVFLKRNLHRELVYILWLVSDADLISINIFGRKLINRFCLLGIHSCHDLSLEASD